MLAQTKKRVVIVITILRVVMIMGVEKKNLTGLYTITPQFQKQFRYISPEASTSDRFPKYSFPSIMIVVPHEMSTQDTSYFDTVNKFVSAITIPSTEKLVFIMTPQELSKRNQGQILADFIAWISQYFKKSSIILLSDRSGNSVVNYATHLLTRKIETIIELYPHISSLQDMRFKKPFPRNYEDFFIIYSDHIQKYNQKISLHYDAQTPFRTILPLDTNRHISAESFLSNTQYAQQLWNWCTAAKSQYPDYKNTIAYFEPNNDHTTYLLKNSVPYSADALTPSKVLSKEQSKSAQRESLLKIHITRDLPLSERTRANYSER